jgi:signal transduction histidine kinase
VGVICATLFVAPRAGLIASALQLLAIAIRLLADGISIQQISVFLAFGAIDLLSLTIPLIVGATLLVRTIRAAAAANARLVQLNATLEQQVAERTAALSVAHDAIIRRDAARVREVSAITHDVYNGLQYIQHTVDDLIKALQQAGISTGWLKPHIQHFAMSMGALHALAGNMRDAILLRHRALNLVPQATDLLALVDRSVQQVDSSFRADACQLLLRLDHSLPLVWCDRERIGRVLTNVLGNALKYTSERYRGRPGGQVSITLVCVAGQVCCRIQDNGIGIDPARLPEVGKPFRRLIDGPDAPDGMGLGLSLCREIMHASGGTLLLESAGPGYGVTVTLGLPSAMDVEPTAAHTLYRRRAYPEASEQSGARRDGDRALIAYLPQDDDADTPGH